jgi:hypothetical protein
MTTPANQKHHPNRHRNRRAWRNRKSVSTSKEGAGIASSVVQQNPTNAPEWRPLRRP